MGFLPEQDQEFLKESGLEELAEMGPEGRERRGALFTGFALPGNLRRVNGGSLVAAGSCDLLVLIPDGYATTKLDSFYTFPRLKRADGTDPQQAGGSCRLFGRDWQFWSRHLGDGDWRVGIDDLRTFFNYIRGELGRA